MALEEQQLLRRAGPDVRVRQLLGGIADEWLGRARLAAVTPIAKEGVFAGSRQITKPTRRFPPFHAISTAEGGGCGRARGRSGGQARHLAASYWRRRGGRIPRRPRGGATGPRASTRAATSWPRRWWHRSRHRGRRGPEACAPPITASRAGATSGRLLPGRWPPGPGGRSAGAAWPRYTGPARYRTGPPAPGRDRKSTRLNSRHITISYAVFCLKKKKKNNKNQHIKKHKKMKK